MLKPGDLTAAWDAREKVMDELVYRAHIYLDTTKNQPKEAFEALSDYFSWACMPLKDDIYNRFKNKLNYIDNLLFAKSIKTNGEIHIFTEKERMLRNEEGYKEMQLFFQDLGRTLWAYEIFVPLKRKPDPGRAIHQMEV